MNTRTLLLTAAALVLAAGAGVLGGRALATGVPTQTPLTWAGTLTDAAGKPYPTAIDVQVAFYAQAAGGTAKCTSALGKAEAGTGRFAVVLPPECVQAVHAAPDLWSEALVGPQKEALPRVHVGAVPYALEAEVAGAAAAATGGLKAQVEGVVGESAAVKASVDGLKVAMDGLKADVAALKAGSGGGGGGPWVVDAKGVKLGTLVDTHLLMFGSGAQHTILFASSTGHLFKSDLKTIWPAGGLDAWPVGKPATLLYHSGADCTGQAVVPWNPSAYILDKVPYMAGTYGNLKYFLAETQSPNTGFAMKSTSNPACTNQGGVVSTHIPLKQVTPAEIGLPPVITPPLTVVP